MAAQRIFTPEEESFIRSNYTTMPVRHMANHLGVWPSVISRFMKRKGIVVPEESLVEFRKLTQYRPGRISPNKGKKLAEYLSPESIEKLKPKWFQKGIVPANTLHDGAVTIRTSKSGKQYKFIRLAKGKWLHLHVYNWLQAGNTLPKGYVVRMIDGDTLNPDISNLELISRARNLELNSKEFKAFRTENKKPIVKAAKVFKIKKVQKKTALEKLQLRLEKKAIVKAIAQTQRKIKKIERLLEKIAANEEKRKAKELKSQERLQKKLTDNRGRKRISLSSENEVFLREHCDYFPKRLMAEYFGVSHNQINVLLKRYCVEVAENSRSFITSVRLKDNLVTPEDYKAAYEKWKILGDRKERKKIYSKQAWATKNTEKKEAREKARREREQNKKLELQRKNDLKKQTMVGRQILDTQKKARAREPQFKTKLVDYSQMKTVRVDAKTVIYIPVDQDPAAAINAYQLRQKQKECQILK